MQNPETSNPQEITHFQRYTGSLQKGNYVWGAAMNFCWTNLGESIIQEPIALQSNDLEVLALVDAFNHPVCTTADLDEPSYFVKAGYGPQTLQQINQECRAKFPEKTFPDLDISLSAQDIIAYAYLFKKVSYEVPFTPADMVFRGQAVAGFSANQEQKKTVEVLHYRDDHEFIIRLRLQDSADELILAKGYNTAEPSEALQALAKLDLSHSRRLGSDDHFKMPLLKLDFRRDDEKIIGKTLANPRFTDFTIAQMFEKIIFELDEKGAKVENEAVITMVRGALMDFRQQRYFYLDKPFWVIMKRRESKNPYFLLGVNNTEFMQDGEE